MKSLLPPNLVLICLIIMALLRWFLPLGIIFEVPWNLVGLAPLLIGLVLNVVGDRQFRRAGTNVKTFNEPGTLVTDGLFQYSRNPMYLGFALVLVGTWFLLDAWSPLFAVLAFVLVADRWYIEYEERRLAAKFGQTYGAYKQRVRRWA